MRVDQTVDLWIENSFFGHVESMADLGLNFKMEETY